MAQCEMCGVETGSPKTVQVEGAELDVCADCADFGTEVSQPAAGGSSSKYSTGNSGGTGGSADAGSGSGSSATAGGSSRSSGSRPRDMFDDMEEVAQDYDQRIRGAREAAGLSQEDLAEELNEKASLIRKLERSEMLPSDAVQRKLERQLDVDLAEESGGEDSEWEGGGSAGEYTLGDVVRRKD
jgi:putative transcription factor